MAKHVLDRAETPWSAGLIEASVKESCAHKPSNATLTLQQRPPARREGSRLREFTRIEATEAE